MIDSFKIYISILEIVKSRFAFETSKVQVYKKKQALNACFFRCLIIGIVF